MPEVGPSERCEVWFRAFMVHDTYDASLDVAFDVVCD